VAAEITETLAAYNRANPDKPAAPFAINQIVHKSNDRLEHDMEMVVKYKVPIVITSLGARTDVNDAIHSATAAWCCTTSSTTSSPARRSRRAPTA
jgi:nitronate monooxygenase